MKGFKAFLSILALSVSAQVLAKDFTNQYCQFTLPDGWNCQLEGSEWVCQSENNDRKKEAIVILAAKIAGPKDKLEEYQGYLKAPKTFTLPGGKTQVSEAKYTNSKTVNAQPWIDSLHLASEVPGFYTRYLATVKEDLGIAVTFSVAKDYYANYQGVFDKMVESLKVFRTKAAAGTDFKVKQGENLSGQSVIDDTQQNVDIQTTQGKAKGGVGDSASSIIFIVLGIAAVVALIKLRKKKK